MLAKNVLLLVTIILMTSQAFAQTTEFRFQGSLRDGANVATGNYDFEFRLFDAVSGGSQVGSTLTRTGVAVASGIFAVPLDFGIGFPGADRFLEIRVRNTGGGAFTPLDPRQQVTSSPYSVKSLNSETATTATNATQLGGVAANQYVITTDPRMTDDRNPTAGNANYVQNQNAGQQAASNFDISGTGTATIFSAGTQFNIGANRVLSNAGTNNLFAGVNAGQSNKTGNSNSFFGWSSGANTTGNDNAFVGSRAGFSNTTGTDNSFFGRSAGDSNTTGNENSFVGSFAGASNTTGVSNSFFGRLAGFANTTGGNNSFVGLGAGNSNTTGDNNSFVGSLAGVANTTGFDNSFFGRNAGRANTTGSFNSFVGVSAGSANTTGTDNSFVGVNAGFANTTGRFNSFVGTNTGVSNTTGNNNSFFGAAAGAANTTGFSNSFFGFNAGSSNSTGNGNSFVGANAGTANTTGFDNSFVGRDAGLSNTTGRTNTFIGANAGFFNTNGIGNAFLGFNAGVANTTGDSNLFIGARAGQANRTGSNNTIIGNNADTAFPDLLNATAIGSNAVVFASNMVRLGSVAVTVIQGQVAYTFSSDKNLKENFRVVNGQDVLRKIRGFNMTSWNYIGQDAKTFRHYGPMAQDFYSAFGKDEIGTFATPTTINSGDMAGVMLAAIKELSIENEAQRSMASEQQKQIDDQRKTIDELKLIVCELKPSAKGCSPK